MRGCLIAFLCKSQTWNKVTDLAPGQLTGPTNGPSGPHSDPEYMSAPPKPTAKAGAKAAPKPAAAEGARRRMAAIRARAATRPAQSARAA